MTIGGQTGGGQTGVRPEIICLGSVFCDRVFDVPAIPRDGVKVLASGFREAGGGMAATAAVAIASLGAKATYFGRVGEDTTGFLLRDWLIEAGVEVSGMRIVPGAVTATSAVLVDPKGERLLAAFTGSGLVEDPDWLPLDRIEDAAAVLCDVRWPRGALALFGAARRAGVPSVLDAEIAPAETIDDLAAAADHIVFSGASLARHTGISDPHDALHAFRAPRARSIGVTLGSRGCLFLEAGRMVAIPGFDVSAKDTNGAGDVFHGAFALAIARGVPVAEAGRFANAAAAVKCAKGDGWRGMPTSADIEGLIEEQRRADIAR